MAMRHLTMLVALNGWWINRLKIAPYNTDIFKINGINNKLIKIYLKKFKFSMRIWSKVRDNSVYKC